MASGGWGSSHRSRWTAHAHPARIAARIMVRADETGTGPVAPCPSLGDRVILGERRHWAGLRLLS